MILSNPETVTRAIRGEKGSAEIEASMPYPVRLPRIAPLRALPKFQIPQNPLTADQSVRRYLSCDPSLGSSLKFKKFTRQKTRMDRGD